MQKNRTEITLYSLLVILNVIILITIINYNYSSNYLSISYVQAEDEETITKQ